MINRGIQELVVSQFEADANQSGGWTVLPEDISSDDWPFPVSAGDMDCDGVITIADVVMLAGYIHGYGPTPCCAPPLKRPDLR